jgi:hypothetical protein
LPSADVYADPEMDQAVAMILGLLVGWVLTWAVWLFQRKADREAMSFEEIAAKLTDGGIPAPNRCLGWTSINRSFPLASPEQHALRQAR